MWSGLHGPNQDWLQADYDIISIVKPMAVKMLAIVGCNHQAQEYIDLFKMGVHHFCCRLQDAQHPVHKTIMSDEDYAETLFQHIAIRRSLGVLWYQIDNEPNWQHMTAGFGPYDYVWYMKRVMRLLKAKLKKEGWDDVVLVAPPLSWSPAQWRRAPEGKSAWILDEWRAAFKFIDTDAGETFCLYDLFHYAGANVYYQYARQLLDPSYGTSYMAVHEDSSMEVVVLEWGCSLNDVVDEDNVPVYTSAQIERARVAQYPEWVERAAASGVVVMSYLWIVGGTPQWTGFALTHNVALALQPRVIPSDTRVLDKTRSEI